jgi:hypothetical protein
VRGRGSHIFLTIGSQMAVRSALRAGRPLPPGRFLVLISVRGSVDPRAIVRLERLGQLKKIHLIGTRTRDLPACSVVPQPTMLPRAPRVRLVLRRMFGVLYQPQMIDDDDSGAIGGMQIGRGTRSPRRKPAPVPLCSPQIPHDLTRARTQAAAVGSLRYGTVTHGQCSFILHNCYSPKLFKSHISYARPSAETSKVLKGYY